MTKLSPVVSKFETTEQADVCDRWLREKVTASLADTDPVIPHEEALARVRAIITKKRGAPPRLAQ